VRLAWFTPDDGVSGDDGFASAPLIGALRAWHAIDVFDARRAHDFVWLHARHPFDLCVYDLASTRPHDFVWAYPCHYPGLLRLPGDGLRASSSALLARDRRARHRVAEELASDADALRPFIMASRLVVVPDAYLARALERRYPGARVRGALIGQPLVEVSERTPDVATVGVLAGARAEAVAHAVERTANLGVSLRLVTCETADELARSADIVVSARWPPPPGLPLDALMALAAGRAVVVLETETTAVLPCLDPQTWRSRGASPQPPPVAVSADPRDEEHSLMLALARLARDAGLRKALGAAAREWWAANGTIARSAETWRALIDEAAAVDPASCVSGRRSGAPDGSERARALLAECGAAVDFLT
jgi:hypothetical protein